MDNLSTEIVEKLKSSISGDLKTDQATRILYSTDASIHKIMPLGVIFPRFIDELEPIVSIARDYHIPIIPRGSGSSLAGQAIGNGLIIDCSRYLNQIVEVNPEEKTAVVEPGLILDNLNKAIKKYNLQFGPDPASSERASLGGCIGNNATGAHSLIHGLAADHVIATDVVLADGSTTTFRAMDINELSPEHFANKLPSASELEKKLYKAALRVRTDYKDEIENTWPNHWRRVSGYNLNYLLPWSPNFPPQWDRSELPYPPVFPGTVNLSNLLVGSEGTLAILRKATVRLVPIKQKTVLAVINYSSITQACDAVPSLLTLLPSAVELIPQSLIRLARSVPAYANQLSFVIGDPAAILVVEFSSDQESLLQQCITVLKNSVEGGTEILVAQSAAQQKQVWDVRKVGLGILMGRLGDIKPATFIEDMAVPVEHLGDFVRELDRILAEHGTEADYYGHASVGCLHIRPLLNLKTQEGRSSLRSIASAAVDLVIRLGGTVSAEHGDGITRGEWLERAYGPRIMEAFHIIKDAADPENIFNPGKIIDTPKMDSHLRYDAQYKPQGWTPVMAFTPYECTPTGIVEAIEQCNGVGVCRKSGGVMCPSFQASGDELLSTRGRSNLLRALVSDAFDTPESALKAVHETLSRCLACKGCKAECPSNVDIAKLKYEFYSYYYSLPNHHHPIRDYVFGYIDTIAMLGHYFSPITNFILGSSSLSPLREKILGLSANRKLPQLNRHSLHKIADKRFEKVDKPDCLFLSDAFNEYFYPDIGMDAIRLLKLVGCDVKLLSTLGTGRTLISKGFLKLAKKQALKLVNEIKKIDPDGNLPVVGLEPSEIYTLKDEFLDFFPDDLYVKQLAERSFMIDEYLLRPDVEGKSRITKLPVISNNENSRTTVLLHGHCYQKAQTPALDGYPVGVAATKALLQSVGYSINVIDDGCCGMAGAFGYEADHYDLSMKVGNLALFPAIKSSEHPIVAAAGISCKSQIEDGTGVSPYHPVTLVAMRCKS